MSQHNGEQHSQAVIDQSNGLSKIWLVPLVALFIGLWMVYYQWANQGPEITIEFISATGIEPEKTKIKTRDVEIGIVKKVELKPDLSGVIVTARIAPNSAHLLTESSNFWLVRPRVSLSGVSGLSTLLSGPYITMEPNQSGSEQYSFVALENPPVTPTGTPGLQITLNSNDEFAFKEGDPIIYKGVKVGEFEDIYFNLEERIVYYNAFIKAPYHKLITENTKFWNVSGIRLDLEANGVKLQTASLETILTNGVTFGIPEGMPAGRQIDKRAYFDIYPDFETASNERYQLGVNFVVLIKDTIRGLKIGAPVEYRGLQIGKVLDVNLPTPDSKRILDEDYAIPVLITIQPSRLQLPDNRQGVEFVQNQIHHWISKGLRASLKMGNLITGALYVDLQHYPNVAEAPMESFLSYNVIPTTSGEIAQITQKVSAVLDNLNSIEFEKLSQQSQQLLTGMTDTADSFQKTLINLDKVMSGLDLEQTNNSLNKMLESIDILLEQISAGSEENDQIIGTIGEFKNVLKQLTPLLQQLNQNPNSLIFADQTQPVIEPKAKTSATQGEHQ